MKFRNIRYAVMVVILLLLITAFPVSANDSAVILERVVQINEYQLILEFSQPIAFNYYSVNKGPFWAIRITDSSYKLLKSGSTNLQWPGILTYADEFHDRLVFTLTSSRLGVDTVTGILNFEGQLSSFKGSLVSFCFEEVSGAQSQGNDGYVGNIYDSLGMVQLAANRKGSVDALYVAIEKDFSYSIDLSHTEGIPNARVDADVYVDTLPSDTQPSTSKPQEETLADTDPPVSTAPVTSPSSSTESPVALNTVIIAVCAVISLAAIAVIVKNMRGGKKK